MVQICVARLVFHLQVRGPVNLQIESMTSVAQDERFKFLLGNSTIKNDYKSLRSYN